MLLVIHIPKTAGTSLRVALAAHFGRGKVAFDYGMESRVTTRKVREHLYADGTARSIPALVEQLRNLGCEALIGHFDLAKYDSCFNPVEMVSLVREPLARACAEYLHRSREGRYLGAFEQFIEDPLFQNMQSRALVNRPDSMLVGLTEHYRESLQRINERFGLRLAYKKRNRGVRGGGLRKANELETGLVERFYELNQEDLDLYRDVLSKFEQTSCRKVASEFVHDGFTSS